MEMLSTSRQQNAVVIKITLDYEWTRRTQICMLQNQTEQKTDIISREYSIDDHFSESLFERYKSRKHSSAVRNSSTSAMRLGAVYYSTAKRKITLPQPESSEEMSWIWSHRVCDLRATVPQPEPHHSDPKLWLDASQRGETWIIWSPRIVDVEPWLRALARDNSELAQSKYYQKRQLVTRSISRAGARLQ